MVATLHQTEMIETYIPAKQLANIMPEWTTKFHHPHKVFRVTIVPDDDISIDQDIQGSYEEAVQEYKQGLTSRSFSVDAHTWKVTK